MYTFTANSKKLISIFLLLSLLFSFSACIASEITTESSAQYETFQINEDFTIVHGNKISDEEYLAVTKLQKGLMSATGLDITAYNERYFDSLDEQPEALILVGNLERSESKAATDPLTYSDYTYEIKSDKLIIITGGSANAITNAVFAFLKDNFDYELKDGTNEVKSAGSNKSLKVGTAATIKVTYLAEAVSLLDFDINDFVFVTPNANTQAIRDVTGFFSALSGARITTVKPEEYEAGKPAIFIGCHYDSKIVVDDYTYVITKNIKDSAPIICINGGTAALLSTAVTHFIENYLQVVEIKAEMSIKFEDLNIAIFNVPGQMNGLVFVSQTETTIATGITYYIRTYKDKNDAPVVAHVLKVEKGCGVLYTGTPGDSNVLLNKSANVPAQMNSAKANGKNVIAGVNADFFDLGGTSLPRGLTVKDGERLSEAGTRPWFGVLADGTPVIGEGADYSIYANTIKNAVGGSHIVLQNGKLNKLGNGSDLGDTRHPRTAVGTDPDGNVYIMVVDGRQPTVSNGASLAEVAAIFREMGCNNAINLDGGGSSTFVLEESGSFKVKNSVSNTNQALRSVSTCLFVLLP